MGSERVLIRQYVLVIWDEGQPTVQTFSDAHDAIETLKDVSPEFQAYLYVCDETGGISRVPGW